MKTIDLGGKWVVTDDGGRESLSATVPGDVYLDLLRAKRIPDPFYRDNETSLRWIGETGWTYSRCFPLPAAFLKHERVLLRCEGLDTLATLRINGRTAGVADNMFRTWEWDVRPFLKPGKNRIEIHFASTLPYIAKREREHSIPCWMPATIARHCWVRKEACNYGWDWGIQAVTCGIWRKISLIAFDHARIGDVAISQDHSVKGKVRLSVSVAANSVRTSKLAAGIQVLRKNRVVTEKTMRLSGGKASAQLTINNPELWWPNNLGQQPLYTVVIDLVGADGEVLDCVEKRIGLRVLHLDRHPDKWGQSFQFTINGFPFFAKGADWIPADGILARITPSRYRKLVEEAAAANMNILRVWGGGVYEDDSFYDACDELGICVWQDFMFSCATYPTFDKAFMQSVEAEAQDNIRRLRHHPSLALWCGNNELEQGLVGDRSTKSTMSWNDYAKLFDQLLPRLVSELDPQRSYWPSSPHTSVGDRKDCNSPLSGDAHIWDVWHEQKPFEFYRTCQHRFCSEFGFQSFPEPRTTYGYTMPEDRNITSRVMEHHQRSHIGNTAMIRYMLDWFRLPEGFDNTLWLSQILQGLAIKYATEHWRRSMPRCMGTLYWQLNDTWPVASWSSIDYHGRWKALHYMAKHFYAPLLISGVEDAGKGTVEIHVTSDLREALPARVGWTVTDLQGKRLLSGSKNIRTPVNANRRIKTVRLKALLEQHGAHNILVWLGLSPRGLPPRENLVLFARPKHLDLARNPGISATVSPSRGGEFAIHLKTQRPALWAWLAVRNTDARFSDNFIHLRPGKTTRVVMSPSRSMTLRAVRRELRIRSLVDTY